MVITTMTNTKRLSHKAQIDHQNEKTRHEIL